MSDCSTTICQKDYPSSTGLLLHLIKNQFGIFTLVCFWVLYSVALICIVIHPPISHYLDYCIQKISLISRHSDSSYFIFFSKLFQLFYSFPFSYKFYNKFVYVYKNSCLNFDQNCFKSIDQLGNNLHLCYTESSSL